MDFYSIPIFIISYNRKDALQQCLQRYQRDGYKNIIILDNASTDEELIDWLKTLSCSVYFLDKNYGHHVLWDCHLFDDIINSQYYVLTDPDILPDDSCPTDYVEQFYNILQAYSNKTKSGFSLRIDDLPDSYPFKWDCIRYESFYWENVLNWKFKIYEALIDTTFALYRPGIINAQTCVTDKFFDGIRTGDVYKARHLGWYWDDSISSNEREYYESQNSINTSMNKEARQGLACEVVMQLAERTELPFFKLISTVATKKYIRKYIGIGAFIKAFSYVLCKVLYVNAIDAFPELVSHIEKLKKGIAKLWEK